MIHHLRQKEKVHPLKKRTNSGAQHIYLSGNPATSDCGNVGFTFRSLERFVFFITILISAKHL